jgi:alanyl-tRNA synthetase
MSAVPTAAQIRQSFLDFFKSKDHTIVPSDNVGYTSRTAAALHQRRHEPVRAHLPRRSAGGRVEVARCAAQRRCDTRAADTQKCIRAGGKHNDLEDVGLDTYHHTFFEMLGNWSFGDYFKKEAISGLGTAHPRSLEVPARPPLRHRLQARQIKGDPAEFDQEAYDHLGRIFTAAGLDPAVHIVNGNKKDNFWMMGDTGPCGPCSEIHVDLTPAPANTARPQARQRQRRRAASRSGTTSSSSSTPTPTAPSSRCPRSTWTPAWASSASAQHHPGHEGLHRLREREDLQLRDRRLPPHLRRDREAQRQALPAPRCRRPTPAATGDTEQEKIDVAFRVIADHIRTLSFAIADGIQPGNTDRNYVLRRILRRAVKYGRTLGFHEPFFYKLVDVLAQHMGDVFPEPRRRRSRSKPCSSWRRRRSIGRWIAALQNLKTSLNTFYPRA